MRFVPFALRGLAALGLAVSVSGAARAQTIVNEPLGVERIEGGGDDGGGGWFPPLATSEEYAPGITIFGTDEYRRETRHALDRLAQTAEGRQILAAFAELGRQGHGVTIRTNGSDTGYSARPDDATASEPLETRRTDSGAIEIVRPGPGSATTVFFDPEEERRYEDGDLCRPQYVGLGHELIHAIHNGRGENLRDYPYEAADGDHTNHEEARTIGLGPYANGLNENDLRVELGYEPRDNHATTCPADEQHQDDPSGEGWPWPFPKPPGKPEKPSKPDIWPPKPTKPTKPDGGKIGGAISDAVREATEKGSRKGLLDGLGRASR